MSRQVTERDFRRAEFLDAKPEDYEFRDDGKLVRKDRFMRGVQDIAATLFGGRYKYEVSEVVKRVAQLSRLADDVYQAAADEIWLELCACRPS